MGSKKAGKRKKPREHVPMELPTPEQLANGSFDRAFIMHAETATKSLAYRNRESSVLERWKREGSIGFGEGAIRVIETCETLWAMLGAPRVIARYGERLDRSSRENFTAADARSELDHMFRGIPKPYLDVFENVVRHNEPAGVAGSRFATNSVQQIGAAKTIVGMVASFVAMRMGY